MSKPISTVHVRRKASRTVEDSFLTVHEVQCKACGEQCVCVEVKHLERKFVSIRWRCERCNPSE